MEALKSVLNRPGLANSILLGAEWQGLVRVAEDGVSVLARGQIGRCGDREVFMGFAAPERMKLFIPSLLIVAGISPEETGEELRTRFRPKSRYRSEARVSGHGPCQI